MSMTFHCPTCGAPLDPPKSTEAALRCPFCASSVIVPEELKQGARKESTLTREQVLTQLPESSQKMMDIIRLIKSGQKEEAIHQFREAFDLSRTEAVATVDAIENNQVVQLSHIKRPVVLETAPPFSSQQVVGPMVKTTRLGAGLTVGTTCFTIGIVFIIFAVIGITMIFAMMQEGGPLFDIKNTLMPSGRLAVLKTFGEEGLMPGQFTEPQSLAVDSAGNIFVGDFTTGRIQQFDPQGNFVRLWDASDERIIIWALEVDQNGILYAAAERNILRYDTRTGAVLDPVPNPENYFFYDIKILSDGSIGAVVDTEDLVRIKPDGSIDWFVENAISSVADESDTRGRLAVDGNNNFYLSGTFVESIFKYSADGKFLNRWGSEGDEPGQFDYIYGLALTDKGQVAVADYGELELFEPDGRFLEQIDLDHSFHDLQFDASGKIYAVSRQAGVEIMQFREE